MKKRMASILLVAALLLGVLAPAAFAQAEETLPQRGTNTEEAASTLEEGASGTEELPSAPHPDGDGASPNETAESAPEPEITPETPRDDEESAAGEEAAPEADTGEGALAAEEVPLAKLAGEAANVQAAGANQVETAALPSVNTVQTTLSALATRQKKTVTNPGVASTGGDWTVLAVARYGAMTDSYKNKYLGNVYSYLQKKNGVLAEPNTNYTEYSRVVLALASLGEDARDVAGYNIFAPLAEYENVTYQGVNGAVWALIALDSLGYDMPTVKNGSGTQASREMYINYILGRQISGGGWNINQNATVTDPDMTGMAIQALAPYYSSNGKVQSAVDVALTKLSGNQKATGGLGSCESDAQVLAALTAVGVSLDDSRFVKNGRTVYDALMDYYDTSAVAFRHLAGGTVNQMATDQGMHALVSLYRSLKGMYRLFDMRDALKGAPTANEQAAERAAIIRGIGALPASPGIKDKGAVNQLIQRLKKLDDFAGKSGYMETLEKAIAAIQKTEKTVSKLDKDIWNKIDPMKVTLKSKATVAGLMKTYKSLSKSDRGYLKNAQSLLDANAIIKKLKKGIIPKIVFENIKGSNVKYKYTGSYENKKYTLTIKGKNVTTPAKMKAGVQIGTSAATDAMARMGEKGYWFCLMQAGDLPAEVTLTMQVDTTDGQYTLYSYNKDKDVARKIGEVQVNDGKLTFTTSQGGDYFLYSGASGGAGFSRSGEDTKQPQVYDASRIIEKAVFEGVQGKDENIKTEGTAAEGVAYRLSFNGENIESPMDFDPALSIGGGWDEEIGMLAEDAFVLHFAHSGALPGKMLVEVQTSLQDGEYLLFYYNEESRKAEMIQGVEVADGWASFFITHCSDYFIAKRALKASVTELLAKEAAEETPVETAAPGEATPDTGRGQQAGAPVLVLNWPLLVTIAAAIACVLGITLGLLLGRRSRKRKNEEMSS